MLLLKIMLLAAGLSNLIKILRVSNQWEHFRSTYILQAPPSVIAISTVVVFLVCQISIITVTIFKKISCLKNDEYGVGAQ